MIEEGLDVDIISEEGETPSEEGSDASTHLWSYTKEEIRTIIDFVHLEAIGQLYLSTPVVEVLYLDICSIARRGEYPVEKTIGAFEEIILFARLCL
jgi:hypothetical protein